MTKNGKHHFPVDRVEGFLEVYKCDSEWELVVLEAFHDPSEDVHLLSTTSIRAEAFSRILLYTLVEMDRRYIPR